MILKSDIRNKARALLTNYEEHDLPSLPEDLQELVEELHIYYIELEMQNEELRQAQIDLQLSQKQYFDLYNLAPIGYITMDQQGRIRNLNLAAAQLLNEGRVRLQGQPIINRISPSSHAQLYKHLDRTFQTEKPQLCELIINRHDMAITPYVLFESTIVEDLTDQNNGERLCRTAIIDISARKELEQQLRQLAHYDVLTGLPNRNLFKQKLDHTISIADQTGIPFALILCDLNKFKNVNDSLGHQIGDILLTQVAERFRAVLPSDNFISRLGGDEFAILIPNLRIINTAIIIIDRLLNSLNKPFELDFNLVFISASIGASIYPDLAQDSHTLFKQSDIAMYKAKEKGNNEYQFYQPDFQVNIRDLVRKENALRKAIKNESFLIYYQPQIKNSQVIGVEALIRWKDQKGNIILPKDFIPFAEKNGLIIPIGQWMIQNACQQVAEWNNFLTTPIKLAVNLSAIEFHNSNIIEYLIHNLEDTQLHPHQLEIEITESLLMEPNPDIIQKMHLLDEKGITIVLDDFGTGYSSLSYLHQFPIKKIKIDRSFIKEIGKSKRQMALTDAIISMANALEIDVIAEGVETAEQVEFLKLKDCHLMQGYLFSRPLSAEDTLSYLISAQESAIPRENKKGSKDETRSTNPN